MAPIHILLIEDSEGDIVLITEALEESNLTHTVDVARDGLEGIKFLKKEPPYHDKKMPDLILMDLNMPKLNGHDVLDIIKTDDGLKHIPVIMLTTSSATADILKSYKKYSNCYIIKPSQFQDFEKVVTAIEHFWLSVAEIPST